MVWVWEWVEDGGGRLCLPRRGLPAAAHTAVRRHAHLPPPSRPQLIPELDDTVPGDDAAARVVALVRQHLLPADGPPPDVAPPTPGEGEEA